jgi:hypothetical protein
MEKSREGIMDCVQALEAPSRLVPEVAQISTEVHLLKEKNSDLEELIRNMKKEHQGHLAHVTGPLPAALGLGAKMDANGNGRRGGYMTTNSQNSERRPIPRYPAGSWS